MKNVFHIVMMCMLLLPCMSAYAQVRADREVAKFITKGDSITKAPGWQRNDVTGKWVRNDNIISDDTVARNSLKRSIEVQSFKWVRTGTIMWGGKKYYIIYWHAAPDNPANKYTLGNTKYMYVEPRFFELFKKQVLENKDELVTLNGNSGRVQQPTLAYNESNLLEDISKTIEEEGTSGNYDCMAMMSVTVDGKKVIRFRLPDMCIGEVAMDSYFEISPEQFKKLLIE